MTLFYHECGNPLAMDGKLVAGSVLAKFYDAREEGEGKPVIYCPTCNKLLLDNCNSAYIEKQINSILI